MPVIENIKVRITPKMLFHRIRQGKNQAKIDRHVEKAVDLAQKLLQPKAACRWGKIDGEHDHRITFSDRQINRLDELFIQSIDCRQSIEDAKSLLFCIATVGSPLDNRIGLLNQAGDYLTAYLLDLIGMIALEQVGQTFADIAECQARQQGWGVSPLLSPGAFEGWGLEGQSILLQIISAGQIGVRLNPQGMMSPLKSVSGIIAIGPKFFSTEVEPICCSCIRNSDCQFKRIRVHH